MKKAQVALVVGHKVFFVDVYVCDFRGFFVVLKVYRRYTIFVGVEVGKIILQETHAL